ncbi:hypothetical protein BELL_0023g00270 [Botrytis elliptica]|uniref:Uncharacterized protein n=1 Tax=Botrytis elliptica TaxID=278938 RepID=A0A4Z1K2Q3_9HELO|nr:hypothetical protein BELL_0023g00270 [Botrytis elliptica]
MTLKTAVNNSQLHRKASRYGTARVFEIAVQVANKDGQHLLEIGFQDKSLKIHDELENIQKRISSIAEEYDQLMGEKTRLRRCSEDIKAMTEISNETTVKEGMTEDQKYVPRVVTAYVQ